jgi:hypothetical protein
MLGILDGMTGFVGLIAILLRMGHNGQTFRQALLRFALGASRWNPESGELHRSR